MSQEHDSGLGAAVAELRADVRHLSSGLAGLRQDVRSDTFELRQDVRRLDGRLFQLLVTQVATLTTALGALLAAIAS